MRSRFFRIFALTAAFFLLPGGTAAGQSTTLISLDQAIDLALAHNHALKASRTLILQNQAQEITANLRPNPTLGADTQFIPFFSPQDFSGDNLDETQQFDIGISYLFERGQKRQHRLQAARDSDRRHARPGRRCRTHFGVQRRPAVRQRVAGGIDPAIRAGRSERIFSRPSISARRSSRPATSEKATISRSSCSSSVSDRRFVGAPGEGAGAGRPRGNSSGYDAVPADYDVIGDLAYQPLQAKVEDLQARALRERPDYRAAELGITAAQSQYHTGQSELARST